MGAREGALPFYSCLKSLAALWLIRPQSIRTKRFFRFGLFESDHIPNTLAAT
jgi:hypothetical protein